MLLAGSATTIPNHPTLAGLVFHQPLGGCAFDLAGSMGAITSRNALAVAIGVF